MSIHPNLSDLEVFRPPETENDGDDWTVVNPLRRLASKPFGDHVRDVGEAVQRLLPVLVWGRAYVGKEWRQKFGGDLGAGLGIGIMIVPQCLAYASLAGLPPIYGLYSVIVPKIIYFFLGTSHEMSLGPVAVNSLLLSSTLRTIIDPSNTAAYVSAAITTGFLTGIFLVLMWALRIGYFMSFVSPAVMTGFISATEILIAFSQLETLLGFHTEYSEYLLPKLANTLNSISETQPLSLAVGFGTMALLEVHSRLQKAHRPTIFSRAAKIVPPALLVLIVGMLVGYYATQTGIPSTSLSLVGVVPSGLPHIVPPELSRDSVRQLILPSISLALLGYMQTVSVAIKFAEKGGYRVDINQELLALGACHVGAAFTQAMDVCGSFSRTAVNSANGAKSQVSSLFSALVVIAALSFATPLFSYIPQPTLAAIVVHAVIKMFELDSLRKLKRTKKRDYQVALVTLALTVLTTSQLGLIAGVLISLFLILSRAAHPTSVTLGRIDHTTTSPTSLRPTAAPPPIKASPPEYGTFRNIERYRDARQFEGVLVWRFDAELWFANAEYFKEAAYAAIQARRASPFHDVASGGVLVPSGTGSDNRSPTNQSGQVFSFLSAEAATRKDDDATVRRRGKHPTGEDSKSAVGGDKAPLLGSTKAEAGEVIRVFILDMSSINDCDTAGAEALLELHASLRSEGVQMLFANARGPVRDTLWRLTGGNILTFTNGSPSGRAPSPTDRASVASKADSHTSVVVEDLEGNRQVLRSDRVAFLGEGYTWGANGREGYARTLWEENSEGDSDGGVTGAASIASVDAAAQRDGSVLFLEQFFLTLSDAVDFARKLVTLHKLKDVRKESLFRGNGRERASELIGEPYGVSEAA